MNWPNDDIRRSLERLEQLHEVCEEERRRNLGSPVVEELSRFLTIRSCGHLEVVTTQSYYEFFDRNASGLIPDYMKGKYKTWRSPKYSNLKNELTQLSPELAKAFSNYLKSGEREYESDLGSLVTSRDKVAHGQNEQVTITKALDYYKSALYVSDWFICAFKPGGLADKLQEEAQKTPE